MGSKFMTEGPRQSRWWKPGIQDFLYVEWGKLFIRIGIGLWIRLHFQPKLVGGSISWNSAWNDPNMLNLPWPWSTWPLIPVTSYMLRAPKISKNLPVECRNQEEIPNWRNVCAGLSFFGIVLSMMLANVCKLSVLHSASKRRSTFFTFREAGCHLPQILTPKKLVCAKKNALPLSKCNQSRPFLHSCPKDCLSPFPVDTHFLLDTNFLCWTHDAHKRLWW